MKERERENKRAGMQENERERESKTRSRVSFHAKSFRVCFEREEFYSWGAPFERSGSESRLSLSVFWRARGRGLKEKQKDSLSPRFVSVSRF